MSKLASRSYQQTNSLMRGQVKIEAAELFVVLHPFQTSAEITTEKVFPFLVLHSEGLEGYAEGVMDPLPTYREETIAGAMDLLKQALLPAVLGKSFGNPQELADTFSHYRGNKMAKAVLEMAYWDVWAKSLGLPLKDLLGGNKDKVAVGVSLGIQSLESTLEQVGLHLEQGYKRIKLKIQPGWDSKVLSEVRRVFPDCHLTVDANSAYTSNDLTTLQKLDDFNLDYIEQPLAFDDLHDHVQLQAQLKTSLCLDESILSASDTRKALETKAGRVINVKVGRVGGHLEARRVHDVAMSFGVPVWCGGMLESGIGRAHNVHLSTLPNFTKPGDTSSSSRYWKQDIIHEPLETKDGYMPVPVGAGIGVTLNREALKRFTVSHEIIKSHELLKQ
jgi:o-succinylbenzoate synthase